MRFLAALQRPFVLLSFSLCGLGCLQIEVGNFNVPASLDHQRLDSLISRAVWSGSDALVVVQDGRLVGEWYSGDPERLIACMSVTKSLVGLAVGRLVDDGKLALDTPVAEFFPAWLDGDKRHVTIAHILTHTTGLYVNDDDEAKQRAADYVDHALSAPLVSSPGSIFLYNNRAVNLLAGIVERASGMKVDDFVQQAFFEPLGIVGARWERDSAGNPLVMAGVQLRARDLVKIGMLLLDDGFVDGRSLLSASWISSMTRSQAPGAHYGFLWWALPGEAAQPDGFAAVGAHGQYLVVVPHRRIVAVRMRRALPFEWGFAQLVDGLRMADFPALVQRL